MFKKLLIANRGEIAARIIRTCKKLGISTVAVYSEVDQKAPYVHMADESYLLGGPRVTESYLNADKIIAIANNCSVDAIHPGYGFLSENSSFAQKCEQSGLTFIGPSVNAIKKMGSKLAARQVMQDASIQVVPGTDKAIGSVDEAIKVAKNIGYPIMLKASAGGGGIGMQVVDSEEELRKAFAGNMKRAEAFFGDGSMFIEKKINNARHIEIQILADSYGNVIHLFDRECSIQRRNQKVIEEAPSPFITNETRNKMGQTAVKAAKAIKYTNAGTIEFLVDENENYYFLEMNTRIQVEHPVTEEITGIDIVTEQLKIAAGKRITLEQEKIQKNGHAIEVRIYAEDPVTFLPSPGQITAFTLPESDYIRNETAVTNFSQVTPFYDPMIGKLIVKGADRNEAIIRLKEALSQYKIKGIKTNVPMLQNIIDSQPFKEGMTTTDFVENYYLPSIK